MPKEHPPLYDFLGAPLQIGDLVAWSDATYSSQNLGKVVGFTAKSVRVAVIPLAQSRSNLGRWREQTLIRAVEQLVRLPEEVQLAKHEPVERLREIFRLPAI